MPRKFIPPGLISEYTIPGTSIKPFDRIPVDFVSELPSYDQIKDLDPSDLLTVQNRMQVDQLQNWTKINVQGVVRVGDELGIFPEGMPGLVAYGQTLPTLMDSFVQIRNAASGKTSPYQVSQAILNVAGDTLNALDNILQVAAFASAIPVVGWVLNVVEGMFKMAEFTAGIISKWGIGKDRDCPWREPVKFNKENDEEEANDLLDFLGTNFRDYTNAFLSVQNPQGIALWRLEEGSRSDKYIYDLVGSGSGGRIIPGFGERFGAFQAWLDEKKDLAGERFDTCVYQYVRPQCGQSWRNPLQSTSEFYPSANMVGNDLFNRLFSAAPNAFFINANTVLRHWEDVMAIYASPDAYLMTAPGIDNTKKCDVIVENPEGVGPWSQPVQSLKDMTGSIWVAPDRGIVAAYQSPVGIMTGRGNLNSDGEFGEWLLNQLNSNNNQAEINAFTNSLTEVNEAGWGAGWYSNIVRERAAQMPTGGFDPESKSRPNMPVPFDPNDRILQCSHMWYIWWVFEKHAEWLTRLADSTTVAYVSENDIAVKSSPELANRVMETRQRILGSLRDLLSIEPELIPDADFRSAVVANTPPPQTLFAQQDLPPAVPSGPDAITGLKAPVAPIPSPRPGDDGSPTPSAGRSGKRKGMSPALLLGGAAALFFLANRKK